MATQQFDSILFVHQPAPNASKYDRALQRSSFRSHAAKQTARRRRQQQTIQHQIRQDQIDDEEKKRAHPNLHSSPWNSARVKSTRAKNARATTQQQLPGIFTLLGEGTTDPFASSVAHKLPPLVQRVLDYAYDVLWTDIVADKASTSFFQKPQNAYRKAAVQSPYLYHAHVASATTLFIQQSQNKQLPKYVYTSMAYHRKKATELVNMELQALNSVPSDELLTAVLTLAAGVHFTEDNSLICDWPISPLSAAQCISLYSTMSMDSDYIQAVYKMVAMKGGLDNVEMYGMAEDLELFDILLATVLDQQPVCPWRTRRLGSARSKLTLSEDQTIDLGIGFEPFVAESIYPSLLVSCGLVIALDQYHNRKPNAPTFSILIDVRNALQHALYSLKRPSVITNVKEAILDACHLAVRSFADMVFFPIPLSVGVRSRLIGQLSQSLEIANSYCAWKSHRGFMIWANVIGCVASIRMAQRPWFMEQLYIHDVRNLAAGSALQNHLCTFLWWRAAFDDAAKAIWNELDRSRSHGGRLWQDREFDIRTKKISMES